jgi:hypothetical protein
MAPQEYRQLVERMLDDATQEELEAWEHIVNALTHLHTALYRIEQIKQQSLTQ